MKDFKTKTEQIQEGKKLSAAILLTVELETNFKLYSYRCIEPKNFMERVDELVSIYKKIK